MSRVGRRAGLELAGWLQAAMLLPFLVAQAPLFDSLLTCAVWGALDAWTRGRDGRATAAASLALLAKGPVAYIFLAPFLWALEPLRPERATRRRGLVVLLLALVPLAAWAVSAAAAGGSGFASDLLWDTWAGRVKSGAAHHHSIYFYLPVLLVGALPCTLLLLLLRGEQATREAWLRRSVWALAGVFVVFSLIPGKQPHYLVPAAPALALACAWAVERRESGRRWLHRGLQLQLLLLLVLIGVVSLDPGRLLPHLGPTGRSCLAAGAWKVPVLGVLSVVALGFAITWAAPRRTLLGLAVLLAAGGASLLGLQFAVARMIYPSDLARALELDRDTPLAVLGSTHHGLYDLLSDRDVECLADLPDLLRWSSQHPTGVIIVDEAQVTRPLPPDLELVAQDVVHNKPLRVLRIKESRTESRAGA